jgi:hypothetical protein
VEVHVFHRCVIAAIGVLAVSTSAAAGPIKLGDSGPSLNIDELRASGARMDDKELRALFFRGGGSRNAAASCAECLVAESSLHARGRGRSDDDAFPFSAASVFPPKPAKSSRHTGSGSSHATVTAVADVAAVALIPPLSSSETVAPAAIAAASPVPEPGSIVLIGTGLTGGCLVSRRRRSRR